ncbi:sensor histidine kinase [Pseudacidobacterium ailaaui]|uniref:sensor histidine kinase n=1 Tax=Pseudacidobacterium ailaaui TaxID=1382359 RepID=UPI000A948DF7|nr:ATP-binding protein [Pseudacidobacterium ailaaui]
MLGLYQRLILGFLFLIALVGGLGMLVRHSFVHLSALDEQQQAEDAAVSAISQIQASLAREQVLAGRLVSHPDRPIYEHLLAQAEVTEQRFLAASRNSALSVDVLEQKHRQIVERLHLGLDHPEAWRDLAANVFRPQLDSIDEGLSDRLSALFVRRASLMAGLDHERSMLRARLIAISGFSLFVALAISSITAFLVIRPIRATTRTAQQIGQGDLHRRIEWTMDDDLGRLATEINRMAIRLRDLRETESGRRQMEQQLSDAIINSIFEPVIVTDAKGHVLKLNQAATELLGKTDRMALTNTPGGEKILNAVRNAVSMQQATAGEGEAALLPMRIGSAERSYRLRTAPMRDADGKLLGAVTVLEDVTEMRDIDRFKTRFLTVASQKLRGPLERLRLALYALTRGHAGELRPLQFEILEDATQEAERLDELMADLIEVAELDTGRRQMKIERLRPFDVLEDASHRFREQARAKNIEIHIEAFEDLSYVSADRRALRSILDNLLANAVRYTPPGGEIRLKASEMKDRIQFVVQDTGCGIEAERLPNIFGRFAGGSSSDGTGLGLALVRRLVESLGGQVAVESRLGQGTSFSFTLPVAAPTPTRHEVEVG